MPRRLAPPFLLVVLLAASASGSESVPPGSGESAWGPIPAPADSVRTTFEPPPRAAWEYPVQAVDWVLELPFDVFRLGVKGTVHGLEDSGLLYRIRQLLAPIDAPFGFRISGVAGRLSGIGGGLSFYNDEFLSPDSRLKIRTSLATRDNKRASLGWDFAPSDQHSLQLGAGYRLRGAARFFGLGPDAQESARSFFTQETSWAGVTYRLGLPWSSTAAQTDLIYSTMDNRGPFEPAENRPTEDRFSAELPTGYGERSDGWDLSLTLLRDTTSQDGRPRGGSLQRARVGYFTGAGAGQDDHVSVRLESQHFLDLWWDRALAVRGFGSWIDSDGRTHFQRLMTNDDPDLLRGFEDFRWRDRGIVGLNVEYRYPIWDYRDPGTITLDSYAFYDTGQVFGEREEIALRDLTHSVGFGFRFSALRGFVGRVEVGFSDEDTVIRLRSDQLFQYAKRRLYHGREPMPSR